MNKSQKKNLDKLIEYVDGLPKAYKRFDMSDFCRVDGGGVPRTASPTLAADAIHACGTSACFLGHGPAAGIRAQYEENWWGYMARQFGIRYTAESAAWLFAPNWCGRNGTKSAAVKRAKEFVEAGYQVTDAMRKKMDRLDISF